MPLDLLKRRGSKPGSRVAVPQLIPQEMEAQEYSLKLEYRAKGSEGVRMVAGPAALDELPTMHASVAKTDIEVIEPQQAIGMAGTERPVPAASAGGLVCAHFGFASGHERAFYCPKCGMRLLRG